MPNHVTNRVTFSGSKEDIATLVNEIKSEKNIFDFNKIVPMPDSMRITSGSSVDNAIAVINDDQKYFQEYTRYPELDRYKGIMLDFKRVHDRLKLTTIYELRAALRELLMIRKGSKITPEQERDLKIRNLEREFVGKKIDGFFPTPEELARDVVEKADIEAGMFVLEPSAGLGHLADAIMEMQPDCQLICVEQYNPLADALRLKGYSVREQDFLECNVFALDENEEFVVPDRIILNPPFENLQDVDHVLHAFNVLKPGGRIVAIMSTSWTFRDNEKCKQFRDFVDEHGTWEKNEEGAFKSAFRPTGVATVTVVLDK